MDRVAQDHLSVSLTSAGEHASSTSSSRTRRTPKYKKTFNKTWIKATSPAASSAIEANGSSPSVTVRNTRANRAADKSSPPDSPTLLPRSSPTVAAEDLDNDSTHCQTQVSSSPALDVLAQRKHDVCQENQTHTTSSLPPTETSIALRDTSLQASNGQQVQNKKYKSHLKWRDLFTSSSRRKERNERAHAIATPVDSWRRRTKPNAKDISSHRPASAPSGEASTAPAAPRKPIVRDSRAAVTFQSTSIQGLSRDGHAILGHMHRDSFGGYINSPAGTPSPASRQISPAISGHLPGSGTMSARSYGSHESGDVLARRPTFTAAYSPHHTFK